MIEQTLIIVKPHAVKRGLVGRIIAKFEEKGYTISHIKTFQGNLDLWQSFYPSDEDWLKNVGMKTIQNYKEDGADTKEKFGTEDPIEIGRLIKGWLAKDMSSGSVVAIIIEGNDAGKKSRLICGATLPNQATPGTIRFDFSSDTPDLANSQERPLHNIVHCADPQEMRNDKRSFDYESRIIFPEIFS